MQRVLTALALAGVLLALGACGGGSKTTVPNPQTGGNNSTGLKNGIAVEGPTSVQGSHTSSIVPNQLNLVTGASGAALQQTLDKFGYSLVHRDGDNATISIPDGNLDAAITELNKEFTVISAEKIHVLNMPSVHFAAHPALKSLSFIPSDPMYGETFTGMGDDGTNLIFRYLGGQGEGQALNTMGFPGGWDNSLDPNVGANPVKVAIIDAGFQDYTTDRVDIDETHIDAVNSGKVDGAGTFTAGLAAATWDTQVVDVGGGTFVQAPVRDMGNQMFSIIAAGINTIEVRAFDFAGDGLDQNDIFNEGIAGINPNAEFVLIKTGSAGGGGWTFTDNEISKSIDHAVSSGANIILLGMFNNSAVGGNVSASIAAARAADILVIAPAGDVVDTYNGDNTFASQPVDITTTSVSPASDPNCLSVAATGVSRVPELGDVTVGGNPIPDLGQAWLPLLVYTGGPTTVRSVFCSEFFAVAPYSNYGATIAACGYGIGLATHPYFIDGGSGTNVDPLIPSEGVSYHMDTGRFSSCYAAAYVAGAASMVYQGLLAANGGTPPADVDSMIEDKLVQGADFAPLDREDSTFTPVPDAVPNGYLNVNKAMNAALGGGTLFTPPIKIKEPVTNQPLGAVTINQDLSLTIQVSNGTGPYVLSVDWGDGAGPVVTNNWVPGTVTTLAGGYGTLGHKVMTITVTDSTNASAALSRDVNVINPLAATILVTDQTGKQVALTALKLGQTYVFEVKPVNMYTGTGKDPNPPGNIIQNVTTFNWDFDGNGSTDGTGTSVQHAYAAPGAVTLKLKVDEKLRPSQTFTIQLNVGN